MPPLDTVANYSPHHFPHRRMAPNRVRGLTTASVLHILILGYLELDTAPRVQRLAPAAVEGT